MQSQMILLFAIFISCGVPKRSPEMSSFESENIAVKDSSDRKTEGEKKSNNAIKKETSEPYEDEITRANRLASAGSVNGASPTPPPNPSTINQSAKFKTSGTWTVPSGVASVTIEVWGAGGDASKQCSDYGGSGGGGGYASRVIHTKGGEVIDFTVGQKSGESTTCQGLIAESGKDGYSPAIVSSNCDKKRGAGGEGGQGQGGTNNQAGQKGDAEIPGVDGSQRGGVPGNYSSADGENIGIGGRGGASFSSDPSLNGLPGMIKFSW